MALGEGTPAAAALGARVIEKHFTLDKTLPGPDHRASLEPASMASPVDRVRRSLDATASANAGSTMSAMSAIDASSPTIQP